LKKLNKGFTIIELLIVIAIIGILATTIAPKLFKEMRKATAAKVQHNLGVIRSRLSLDETLLEEFPDFFLDKNVDKTNLLKLYSIESTPAFTDADGGSHEETSQVVPSRNDEGGWFYIRETGEIYANLPNGAYTGDKEYEIWDKNNQIVNNTLSYDFTDSDNFANNFTGNMKGWTVTADGKLHSDTANRGVREGQAITKNPFEEYIVESRVNFTYDRGGYGIYIQSDKNTSGYIFQYDKGFGNGALIIRERLLGDNGKINENIGTVVLAKTKDNNFMTDEWWTSEHDVQIKVTNKNSSKQNVEILIDGRVITSDFEIDKPNDENYTGFRSWKGDIDVDHLNISEL